MNHKLNPPQIVVAQLGARMHYAVPLLLHQAGMLAHFFTDAYVGRGSAWHGLSRMAEWVPVGVRPAGLERLLSRRANGLPSEKVTAFNLFGLAYFLAQWWAKRGDSLDQVYQEFGLGFAEMVRRHPACQGQGLYTFPATAAPLCQYVSQFGMKVFLEQFSAPRKIMAHIVEEENERWPGWEPPSPWGAPSIDSLKLEEQEFHLADAIICPSEFVAQSLRSLGTPSEKIHLVSYGVDSSKFFREHQPWTGQRPLRLLFLGGVNLLKGIPYLYQALEHLITTQVTLRLVGSVAIQEPYRNLLAKRGELVGLVPRTEVQRHYAWADVFVFPSLCEGSATVTYEALAAGLPVITTPNAGSVVRDGLEGFIVPIRDPGALAAKIDLLCGDPELLAEMSGKARKRGQEFSWQKYGDSLTNTLTNILYSGKASGI